MTRHLALLVLLGLVLGSASAHADVTGPDVSASVPFNAPLTPTLRVAVVGEYPETGEDATIRPSLSVGGATIAVLPTFTVHVTSTPIAVPVAVPAATRAKLLRAAAQAHAHRASLHLTQLVADTVTGALAAGVSQESFLSLGRPVVPRHDTRMAFAPHQGVDGADEEIGGHVVLPRLASWPRTSTDGAAPATFLAPLGGIGCSANLLVQPIAWAARSAAVVLGPAGDEVAQGADAQRAWWVSSGDGAGASPWASAKGVLRIARHRYAGIRVDVQFDPACTPAAAKDGAVIAALRRLVSSFAVRARIGQRAG